MHPKHTCRRAFLKRAGHIAAAAMVPTIIPASALARGPAPAPSDRITMGVIGLGGQGTFNMRAFIHQPDTQLVALCDVEKGNDTYDMLKRWGGTGWAGLEPGKQEALKNYEQMGKPVSPASIATYTDFRELLARQDIDAVCIATPDHWHGLISLAALQAGKDVYCEKPLVNSIAEGRAVVDAVRKYRRVLQTGSHERSNDSVRYACELVRNGRIGTLQEIHVNMPNRDAHHLMLINNTDPKPPMPVPESLDYDFWLGPAPWADYTRERTHFWWRFITDYGGGEMTDRGAHIIDLAQFINDTDDSGPVAIRAKGKALQGGLYDAFIEYDFECEYANGVKMIGGSEGDRGLKLVGSQGWIFIHIHGGRLEASNPDLLKETIGATEIHVGRSPGHHRNFLDCVIDRQQPVAHAEIGHRTATICHLLNIGLLNETPLKWDPVTEQVLNHRESDRLCTRPMRSPWTL